VKERTDSERCKACRHFEGFEEDDNNIGYCRRFPPSSPNGDDIHHPDGWTYPVVWSDGWCGEHSAMEQATARNGK
jgi:hypothetical protein